MVWKMVTLIVNVNKDWHFTTIMASEEELVYKFVMTVIEYNYIF